MNADSTEEAPFPPPQIHMSTSIPGSSVPIRAPLTIDSDSEFCLSVNGQIYSRTSSFNSSSSIDISSYGDEHVSVLEEQEEDDTFLAYPDEKTVIQSSNVEEYAFTRPFVKYPDRNYVKESSDFDESAIFRPFVKYPDGNYVKESSGFDKSAIFRPFAKIKCEESSTDSGIKSGVPVAHLTSDCDSDVDSNDSRRWSDSGRVQADEFVQKVDMVPKVQVFDDDLQVEGMDFGDGISNIDESNGVIKGSVLVESIEDKDQNVESVNEDVKISESDELNFNLERIDDRNVSDSETENGTINKTEHELKSDCYRTEISNVQVFDGGLQVEGVYFGDDIKDTNNIDESDGAMKGLVSAESIEGKEQNVESLIEVVNLSESDESSFHLERTEDRIVSDSENEIEIETINDTEQELESDCSRTEFSKPLCENDENNLDEMQPVRAKFLNIIRLLGLSNEDPTVTQLLQKLTLEKKLKVNVDQEVNNNDFDFHLTILVIGKTGVGKSATINSIFGETKASTNAFRPCTTTVQEIIRNINGIQLRIIDTPGLKCSPSDRSYNLKILSMIKRITQKDTPDILLYIDRLDTYTRDNIDSQLLRLITSSFGASVWRNCIIALTHSASLESSEVFVSKRCRFIQEQIVSFKGSNRNMVNPVWLVENNTSYQQEDNWRNRFLLLCYAAKILGHNIDLDCKLEGCDRADEDECDRVPPFEPLSESSKAEKRNVEHKKAYFELYNYRVRLLGTKSWFLGVRLYS